MKRFQPLYPEMRRISQLATPLVGSRLANAIVRFLGMLMVAQLGERQLAAGALVMSVFISLLMISWGMLYAVGVHVSKAFGSRDKRAVGEYCRSGLLLATLIGFFVIFVMRDITAFLQFFGQPMPLIPLVSDYLKVISWGVLPCFWFMVIQQVSAGLAKSRIVMVCGMLSLPLTLIPAYGWVFGHFGLTKIGMSGLAWAYVLNYWVIFLIGLGYLLTNRHFRPFQLFSRCWHISLKNIRQLMHVGGPISVQYGMELGVLTIITFLIGRFGTDALAAQQIAMQVSLVVIMIPFGIGQATAVLIGRAYGEGRLGTIVHLGYAGMALGAFVMSLIMMAIFAFPTEIVNLYVDVNAPQHYHFVYITESLLFILALSQLTDGIRNIAAGALRGLHESRIAMIVSVLIFWGISLPLGYLMAFHMQLGPCGLLWGFFIGTTVGALALVFWFKRYSQLTLSHFTANPITD